MISKAARERLNAAESHVDREILLTALLTQMRGRPIETAVDAGRYAFLWSAIKEQSHLLEDLAQGRKAEWKAVIDARCSQDPEFLRGIALLYWEWALESEADADPKLSEEQHERAKYYWAHLLGRKDYWQSLEQRYSAGEAKTPPGKEPAKAGAALARDAKMGLAKAGPALTGSIKAEDAKAERGFGAEAAQRVRGTLLGHHLQRSRDGYHRYVNETGAAQKRGLQQARAHLSYLCGWDLLAEDGARASKKVLLKQEWDSDALKAVDQEAERLVSGWISEWLTAANRALDDREVNLPRGISKNFAGALSLVRPCLELVEVRPALFQRLLLFVLRQSNAWCLETAHTRDMARAEAIIQDARDSLARLVTLIPKPGANAVVTAEQGTISLTYLLLAQLVKEPELMTSYAKEAAAWRPGDEETGNILTQMSHAATRVRLDQAREYIEAKEYQQAVDTLTAIDLKEVPEAREATNQLLAVTHFQWSLNIHAQANQLAQQVEQRKVYRNIESQPQIPQIQRLIAEARDHMVKALEYEPQQPVLKQNVADLRIEAEHFVSFLKLKISIQCFERDDYGNALLVLENIPRGFPEFGTVTQVRAGSYFRRAIDHAQHERFTDAVRDMRAAHQLLPDQEVIRQQLAQVEALERDAPHIKAVREAQALMEKEDFAGALRLLVGIPPSFGEYEGVKRLCSVCEFREGIKSAQRGEMLDAIAHLEAAQTLNPTEPAIRKQLEELRRIQQTRRVQPYQPFAPQAPAYNPKRDQAYREVEEVVREINQASARNPLSMERAVQLLLRLNQAVTDSGEDPQIVAVRDQFLEAMMGSAKRR